MFTNLRIACFAVLLLATLTGRAADTEIQLTIQSHKFIPAEVRVPSGQRIKLLVLNKDDTPEEFESKELGREKIIPGASRATIFIGPLAPGRYPFFGEFHQSTAQGVVVAE
ncbi:MAG: cupredoxin domain-containing protein [Herminiimonas sp.]|nr:cupredoxin domain-containing protein [Herminiimonas sp.]